MEEGIILKQCPVCKKGQVNLKFGWFSKLPKISCNSCYVKFSDWGMSDGELVIRPENSNQKNQPLKISEWQSGRSELDTYKDKLPVIESLNLKIILKPNEVIHHYSEALLKEERAVRHSSGTRFRVMKGVWVGGGQSHSIGELTNIDNGLLILTNQRLIFNGILRNSEHKLDKINIVDEVNLSLFRGGRFVNGQALEIAVSNRQKAQVFVVAQPHKFAVYLRKAIEV